MTQRAIGIASLIYGVTILASRLIGLIREAVIGRVLGAGSEADVYWTAFIIPDFLNYLLAGGILSIAFIPIFQRKRLESQAAATDLFNTLFNCLAIVVTGLTIILWLFVPKLTPLIAPGLSPDSLTLLNHLVRIILPAQIFHLCGALLSATLQARDKHFFPALAPVVYTACIVVGGLVMGESMGAEGFAWGVLIGSILGPMLCPLLGALKTDLKWKPTLNLRDPELKKYLLISLPIMLGVSVVVLDDMIVKRFASLLPGTGSISQLQYARTLMKVPMGVFGMAAGMAAFPTLSRLFAKDQREAAYDTLVQSIRMTMILAFAAQAALSCVGTEIATVIWGQSRFSEEMLSQIGLLTATYSLGLWAWSVQGLLARGYYAQGNTWTPTIIGSLLMLFWLPIYTVCADSALNLSLASSGIICIYVFVLAWHFFRHQPTNTRPSIRLWSPLPVWLLSTGIAIYLTRMLKTYLALDWPILLSGALYGTTAIALMLGSCYILGNKEIKFLAVLVQRKLRRQT